MELTYVLLTLSFMFVIIHLWRYYYILQSITRVHVGGDINQLYLDVGLEPKQDERFWKEVACRMYWENYIGNLGLNDEDSKVFMAEYDLWIQKKIKVKA